MDLPSRERWYDYSRARDQMFEATDTNTRPGISSAPTTSGARGSTYRAFSELIPYEASPQKKVKLPTRDKSKAYDDEATIKDRRWIEEQF